MGHISIRGIFLLLTLAALPNAAFGALTTTDLGTLGVGDISVGPVMHGPGALNFEDAYTFKLDGPTEISLSGSWTTTPGLAGITGQIFLIFIEGPGIPVSSNGTIGPGDVFTLAHAGLTSLAEYTIRIFGMLPPGGTLTYSANVAVVPLPPAVLLFGSALLAMLLFGRIRRRNPQLA